ncbi:uncharacterized protein [Epargyreus clarus]|uniref:uncharacterized protein n=1 Tax=Epargyreus clarus TaxID=520877 RepID=UPI003C2CD862
MMGSKNSVASRFLQYCPGIYIFKCICHSLHLCASEACKELPRGCEALARNIYNEFSNSAKRQYHFQEFQTFLDIKVHKILRPSQTRWLSLSAVVVRILEQWGALQLYFRDQMLTARLHSVEQIVQALENPIIKLFYLFLEWVLPKFTKLNELFQFESVILTNLYAKMTVTYQELLETYLSKSYVQQTTLKDVDPSNEEQRLRPEQMYFDVKVMEMFSKPNRVADKDGFIKVERKKKKPPCRNQCGTAPTGADHVLRPAVPVTLVYVSRLHYNTKPSDVVEYLAINTNTRLVVEKLEARNAVNFSSFVVRVPTEQLLTFLKEELWPKGVVFRKFRGRRGHPAVTRPAPHVAANT